MPRQRGSANSETKQTERRSEDEDYNPIKNRIRKVQKEGSSPNSVGKNRMKL